MWERANLKMRAKAVLKGNYWKAFVVSLLLMITTGSVSGSAQVRAGSTDSTQNIFYTFAENGLLDSFLVMLAGISLVVVVLTLALGILVFTPLQVGCQRYFVEAAQYRSDLGNVGFGFGNGAYWNVVLTMLWTRFLNFLWFLLLVIPGVVMSYAYSMVPYLLADNPHMSPSRAVSLSVAMTRGHKWRMFVLDLSFFGWLFLGALACGIGIPFVMPYIWSTQAELYLTLREVAIHAGLTGPEELRPR